MGVLCPAPAMAVRFQRYAEHVADGGLGVPMEVMGLMLGDFVDDYTVRVVDVRSNSDIYPLGILYSRVDRSSPCPKAEPASLSKLSTLSSSKK